MRIRTGGPESAVVLLALLDDAVGWLAARGRTDQWGAQPWSERPGAAARAERVTRENLVRIAEPPDGGDPLGVCVLAERAPGSVPPADEPELFVRWLLTDPAHRGAGVGAALVADARAQALARGRRLLRVDCYAGGDGRLVAQYERLGFTRAAAFVDDRPTGPWPWQLLEQRVDG